MHLLLPQPTQRPYQRPTHTNSTFHTPATNLILAYRVIHTQLFAVLDHPIPYLYCRRNLSDFTSARYRLLDLDLCGLAAVVPTALTNMTAPYTQT